MHLSGSKAGVWRAWASGKGGDALDLIAAVKCADDKREAIRWAFDWLRIELQDRAPSAAALASRQPQKADQSAEEKRGAAFRLWLAGSPLLPGDDAYDYLADTRGIDFAELRRDESGVAPLKIPG